VLVRQSANIGTNLRTTNLRTITGDDGREHQ
jgi:hypothetical protein